MRQQEVSSPVRRRCRDRERGTVLIVAMLATVGLVSVGGLSVMAARSELRSAAQLRFKKVAMYSAESGAVVAMNQLRQDCAPDGGFFSAHISPPGYAPPENNFPGNKCAFGDTATCPNNTNPFDEDVRGAYEIGVYNNVQDPGYDTGDDADGRIVLRSIGTGPNNTRVILELEVRASSCIASFCANDYAQKNVSQRNDAVTVCSERIESVQQGEERTMSLAGA